MSMKRVAIIGLGTMGAPIARRLLGNGCQITVWNRSLQRLAALQEAGAAVGASPADAVRGAEVVIVMVTDPQALLAVTEGEHGIAAGQDYSAVLAHILRTATKGPQR
jgi:3-hydroxyisobutyrate dehydrogenase-like beta-hydroxyacid dehydrogenase